MANFTHVVGRQRIFFSNHALERFWERNLENGCYGRREALEHLRERLSDAKLTHRDLPPWITGASVWHRAITHGFLHLDDHSGFVINKVEDGNLLAVTYIQREEQAA